MKRTVKKKKPTTRKRSVATKRSRQALPSSWPVLLLLLIALVTIGVVARRSMFAPSPQQQLEGFQAQPLSRVRVLARPLAKSPSGIALKDIQAAYNLKNLSSTGSGTIAIVNAYDAPTIEKDLATFNKRMGVRGCTTKNGCFEKHKMASKISANRSWALETALDVQWAHAIAPTAKILLVEAKSNKGTDLLKAVDYARNRARVVAISLSWGGDEFSSETVFDDHFVSSKATFFAASGDTGNGTIWPAVSPNVVAVGGTTLRTSGGQFQSEKAWSGSGGGMSTYVPIPDYQQAFGIERHDGKRAIPDIAYNADPATGFPVYNSYGYNSSKGWFRVGGTSAGAPQWAAIHARGKRVTHQNLYQAAKQSDAADYLRDITEGTNGTCRYYCETGPSYDYVTGLGSPLTILF